MQKLVVGTMIPEVKARVSFNLPVNNNEKDNSPYIRISMLRNNKLGEKMNQTLIDNTEKGIYGLENIFTT